MHTTSRRLVGVLAATTCAVVTLAATGPADAADGHRGHPSKRHHHSALMPIQLLSFNDFHGNLEPPSGSSGRNVVGHRIDPETGKPVDVTQDAGGVAYLATHLAQARKGHPNSLTVAAGDIIGASPLLSAAFHDEPTIESMNKLGLDVTAVGNHEFDEGYKELQRMAQGRLHRRRPGRREQPELLRRPHLQGCEVRLPRRQREVRRHRPDHPAVVLHQERCTAPGSASSA